MIESLYPVKQRHMDQALTHSRTLPEAPASNLGHPCTSRFLCSCWEELPAPRPRGAQKLSLRRAKKKILLKKRSSPLQSCHNVSLAELSHPKPGIWLATARIFKPSLSYLHQSWIRFFITSYLVFFPHWWLKRCKHCDLLLAKLQHWRTAQHKSQHTRSIQ